MSVEQIPSLENKRNMAEQLPLELLETEASLASSVNAEEVDQLWSRIDQIESEIKQYQNDPNFPIELMDHLNLAKAMVRDLKGEDGTTKGVIDNKFEIKSHGKLAEKMANYYDNQVGSIALWGGRGEIIYAQDPQMSELDFEYVYQIKLMTEKLAQLERDGAAEDEIIKLSNEIDLFLQQKCDKNNKALAKFSMADIRNVIKKIKIPKKIINMAKKVLLSKKNSVYAEQFSIFSDEFYDFLHNSNSVKNLHENERLILNYIFNNPILLTINGDTRVFDCIGLAGMALNKHLGVPLSKTQHGPELAKTLTSPPYNWKETKLMRSESILKMPNDKLLQRILSTFPKGSIIMLINDDNRVAHVVAKGNKGIIDPSFMSNKIRIMPEKFLPAKLKKYYKGFWVLSPPESDNKSPRMTAKK